MAKINKTEEAYSGKYVTYRNKIYWLAPEIEKEQCKGCALYNKSCPSNITDLCTQGFVLKKV